MYLEIIALPDSPNLSPIAFAGMMLWRIPVDPANGDTSTAEHLREFIAKESDRIENLIGSRPQFSLVAADLAAQSKLLDGVSHCMLTPVRAKEIAMWLGIESVTHPGASAPSALEEAAATALRNAATSWGYDPATTIHLHLALERTNLARPVQMAGLKMCECVTGGE